MGQLFLRTGVLTLGTTQITFSTAKGTPGLKVAFHVTKNLKPEPNKVTIQVWNLAPQTRKALESPATVPVQLDVGYGGDNATIYLGQLRSAETVRDGADIITTIASLDSAAAHGKNRIKATIPQQATAPQILTTVTAAMQVGAGNLAQQAALATATTGGPARVIHGLASTAMSRFARANGLQWSVQDGVMQLTAIGGYVGQATTAVVLNPMSGMVESPSSDNKGVVKVTSLIQPGLFPGRPVVVQGQFISGTLRIEEVEFEGDTWGPDWTASITARKWQ
jgi:hypothetical protein